MGVMWGVCSRWGTKTSRYKKKVFAFLKHKHIPAKKHKHQAHSSTESEYMCKHSMSKTTQPPVKSLPVRFCSSPPPYDAFERIGSPPGSVYKTHEPIDITNWNVECYLDKMRLYRYESTTYLDEGDAHLPPLGNLSMIPEQTRDARQGANYVRCPPSTDLRPSPDPSCGGRSSSRSSDAFGSIQSPAHAGRATPVSESLYSMPKSVPKSMGMRRRMLPTLDASLLKENPLAIGVGGKKSRSRAGSSAQLPLVTTLQGALKEALDAHNTTDQDAYSKFKRFVSDTENNSFLSDMNERQKYQVHRAYLEASTDSVFCRAAVVRDPSGKNVVYKICAIRTEEQKQTSEDDSSGTTEEKFVRECQWALILGNDDPENRIGPEIHALGIFDVDIEISDEELRQDLVLARDLSRSTRKTMRGYQSSRPQGDAPKNRRRKRTWGKAKGNPKAPEAEATANEPDTDIQMILGYHRFRYGVIAMEQLDVSLDQVMDRVSEVPKDMHGKVVESFFPTDDLGAGVVDLQDKLAQMHTKYKVAHADLHFDNIWISKKSFQPDIRLIDFGSMEDMVEIEGGQEPKRLADMRKDELATNLAKIVALGSARSRYKLDAAYNALTSLSTTTAQDRFSMIVQKSDILDHMRHLFNPEDAPYGYVDLYKQLLINSLWDIEVEWSEEKQLDTFDPPFWTAIRQSITVEADFTAEGRKKSDQRNAVIEFVQSKCNEE